MHKNPIADEPVVRSVLPATVTLLLWRIAVGYTDTPGAVSAILDEFFPLYALLLLTIVGFQRAVRGACVQCVRAMVGVLGRRRSQSHDVLWRECGCPRGRPIEAIVNIFAGQLFVLMFLLTLTVLADRVPWNSRVPAWLLASSVVLTGATIVWVVVAALGKRSYFQDHTFTSIWDRSERTLDRRPAPR